MRRRGTAAALAALLAAACSREPVAPHAALYPSDANALLGVSTALPPAQEPMPGLLFVAPLKSRFSFLLDAQGKELHRWESEYFPGAGTELLEDGSILRCGRVVIPQGLTLGGQGGRVQRIAWDGALLWDFGFASENVLHHHDAALMPNGNVLILAWERKPAAQALARGRDAELLEGKDFWPDWIAEIRPQPPTGGEIVWEWHAWDHLWQDPAARDRGALAEHPELIDINGDRRWQAQSDEERAAEAARLAELGYSGEIPGAVEDGGQDAAAAAGMSDWMHSNSISYHAELDLIVISVRRFHEAWVIDHSTTTAEAASHAGGRHGKGGDILYRWGNPQAHGAGSREDQRFFYQHHVHWIPRGLPGAGNLMCFNNGEERPDGNYSTIEEWRMPIAADGRISPGPEQPLWRYVATPKEKFYSAFISGVQRLPNGSTLITEGETGRLLEVSSDGRILWEWQNPIGGEEGQTARTGQSARVPQKALFRAAKIPLDHPVAKLLK
jgi:hypothetical protein